MTGPREQRDERIAELARALAGGEAPGTPVRVIFDGLAPSAGISETGFAVHDLPAGCLRLDVYALLGAITTGPPGSTAATDKNWPVAAGSQRTNELWVHGWTVDPAARRTWEVDPADPESLGQVVDGIATLIDISARIAGVTGADQTTWSFRRAPAPPPTAEAVPPDEPWCEDATEPDLRTLIVRLTKLRGGRIIVRSPRIAIVQLELTASRRGDRITVRASDDLSSWRGHWTKDATGLYVGGILEELREALSRYEPGAPDPTPVSVRIERHDEAAGWVTSSAYALVGAWLATMVAGAIGGARLGHPAVTIWLDEATRLASDQGGALVLLAGVAATAFIPVILACTGAEAVCSRMRIGYAISAWVDFGAATVAGVAFIAFLATTGDQTLLVIAATWAIGITLLAGPGLVARLRARRGRHRPRRS
jgi:hypothetical protein